MTQASADSRQTFSIINLGLGRWSAAQQLGPPSVRREIEVSKDGQKMYHQILLCNQVTAE